MPLYDYRCPECGHTFERIGRFSDGPTFPCRQCNAPAKRLLGVPALQFKGSGWYVTDYGRGNNGPAKPSTGDGDGAAVTTGTSDTAESKSKPGSAPAPASGGSSNGSGSTPAAPASSSGGGSEHGSKASKTAA